MIMLKVDYKLNLEKYNDFIPKQIQFASVFFDIETTGLSKNTSEIFIAGLLYFKDGLYHLNQLFSPSSINERNLIQEISNVFSTKEYIITYNGNNFDIPFYLNKCSKYGIYPNLKGKILIDLYIYIKKMKLELNLIIKKCLSANLMIYC